MYRVEERRKRLSIESIRNKWQRKKQKQLDSGRLLAEVMEALLCLLFISLTVRRMDGTGAV